MSLRVAAKNFQAYKLPRRVRDIAAEQHYYSRNAVDNAVRYRKVHADELDRGDLYPYCGPLSTLSHFGVGIGAYFMILLMLPIVFFIAGMIYVPAFQDYSSPNYPSVPPESYQSNYVLKISAACENFINVTATIGCVEEFGGNSSNCSALYNDGCELPAGVAITDLSVCLFLIASIGITMYCENLLAETLDINIQTSSDYSLIVLDPPSDAIDPDEWYDFFSRYGIVKMISIIKDTSDLTDLLLEKVSIARACALKLSSELKLDIRSTTNTQLHFQDTSDLEDDTLNDEIERVNAAATSGVEETQVLYYKQLSFVEILCQRWFGINLNRHCMLSRLSDIEKILSDVMYKRTSPVTRVVVVFEREEHKALAHEALEVPDLYAMLDLKIGMKDRDIFRNRFVLDVAEPPEPDCVCWNNLHITGFEKRINRWISFLVTVLLIVCSYYMIHAATYAQSSLVLPITVGIINSVLPTCCLYITKAEKHVDESIFQSSLQQKLFFVRMLLSTIFPYASMDWKQPLQLEYIQNIFNIQVAACFTNTFVNYLDIYSVFNQRIVAPCLAHKNQQALNALYTGTRWNLSERYTALANIIIVCLFYSLVNPTGILTAVLAFLFIFAVDRYLLFRRWETGPQIGLSVSTKLRFQILLAVAAHMYVSLRIIYSWPMDSASPVSLQSNPSSINNTALPQSLIDSVYQTRLFPTAAKLFNLFPTIGDNLEREHGADDVYMQDDHIIAALVADATAVGLDDDYWSANYTDTIYRYADKFPSFRIYSLTTQPWMSDSQKQIFPIYKIATFVVFSLVILIGVVLPIVSYLRKLLMKSSFHTKTTDIAYSAVPRIAAYVPLAGSDTNKVMNSNLIDVHDSHLPVCSKEYEEIGSNLVNVVPKKHVPYLMNAVKQYNVSETSFRPFSSDNTNNRYLDEQKEIEMSQIHGQIKNSAYMHHKKSMAAKAAPAVLATSSLRLQGGFATDAEMLRIVGNVNSSGPKADITGRESKRSARSLSAQQVQSSDAAVAIAATDNAEAEAKRRSIRKEKSMRALLGMDKNKKYSAINPEASPASEPVESDSDGNDADAERSPQQQSTKAIDAKSVSAKVISGETGDLNTDRNEKTSASAEAPLPEFGKVEKRILCQIRRGYIRSLKPVRANDQSLQALQQQLADEAKDIPVDKLLTYDRYLAFPEFYAYVRSSNEELVAQLDSSFQADEGDEGSIAGTRNSQQNSKRILRLVFITILEIQVHLLKQLRISLSTPSITSRQDRELYESINKTMLEARVDKALWDHYVKTCVWQLGGVSPRAR